MVSEYFIFQNPEGLAVGVFIILFAVTYAILIRFMRNKGPAMIISLIAAGTAGWQLYRERYYGLEGVLAFVLIIMAIVILWKYLIIRFFRGAKVMFGN